jgi:predicted transcriptional regulator YheO
MVKNRHHHPTHGIDDADNELIQPKKVTGKELSEMEEMSARITTLIEMLDEKGIINKKEYNRIVAMRLHEISKAGAFEQLDEEI